MKPIFAVLLLLAAPSLLAQDTFSIVAVDPETGEVGSAGASCLGVDVAMISDLHPGIGAINTQALYHPSNQAYAGSLLEIGTPPTQIIAMLVENDVSGQPGVRQYGIAALDEGGATAAFTGDSCQPYRGHLLGATWSIQGNILLGAQILDSMAARFERAEGSLAERLMYSLMGARVQGADSRCLDMGTSSLAAFVRVARPGDRPDSILLDLRVTEPFGIREPLDTLQSLFNRWKLAGYRDEDAGSVTDLSVKPNPITGASTIVYDLQRPAHVRFTLYDSAGREIGSLDLGRIAAGPHELPLARIGELSGAAGLLRMSAGRAVVTRMVGGR